MPALRRGDSTTKDNLNIFIYDRNGHLKDPYSITFDLYDLSCGQQTIIGAPDRLPIKFAVGSYFAPWTIPELERIGPHKIIWKIKETAISTVENHAEEFDIVSRLTVVNEDYPEQIKRLIEKLRVKLRDIHPDRDYHFSPPNSEQTIAGLQKLEDINGLICNW